MNSKNNENIQNVKQEERTLKAFQASLRFTKERQRAYAKLNFNTMIVVRKTPLCDAVEFYFSRMG